jgi:hypothetical protein
MKLNALALCIAGTLVAGTAAFAADEPTLRIREAIADPCPPHVVAQKTAMLTEQNLREAATMRAMAQQAQTAGNAQLAAAYNEMAMDHQRLADDGRSWLVAHGYAVPPEPTITLAAGQTTEAACQQQIAQKEIEFNQLLDARRLEHCPSVRAAQLATAATMSRHLSMLRQLCMPAPAPAVAVAPVVEERIVERIVEKPVIVERIVEKPVIVERIVEKPVIVERIVERVAGEQQVAPRVVAPVRRPAK